MLIKTAKTLYEHRSKKDLTKLAALVKGELNSNYIFLYFVLIGLEWDSINLFTKMNFFVLPKLSFQHHLHKAYI